MSSDYIIRFIGHIVPNLRPHGFPDQVSCDLVVRVDDLAGLRKMTNTKYATIITNRGMFAFWSPDTERAEFEPDAQYYVPLSMMSYIETKTIKLASEVQEQAPPEMLS